MVTYLAANVSLGNNGIDDPGVQFGIVLVASLLTLTLAAIVGALAVPAGRQKKVEVGESQRLDVSQATAEGVAA